MREAAVQGVGRRMGQVTWKEVDHDSKSLVHRIVSLFSTPVFVEEIQLTMHIDAGKGARGLQQLAVCAEHLAVGRPLSAAIEK